MSARRCAHCVSVVQRNTTEKISARERRAISQQTTSRLFGAKRIRTWPEFRSFLLRAQKAHKWFVKLHLWFFLKVRLGCFPL
jgi:hypothetical protein